MKVLVVGAVHISQALAPMARGLDLDVTIIDPRTAFATPERFPDVPVLAEWPDAVLPRIALDRYTAMVALTHDPKIDDPALEAALRAECFYIGALGLTEDSCRPGRAARSSGLLRGGDRAHPCPDRPRHRRGVAGRDRRLHPCGDRRDPAPGPEAGGVIFGPFPVEEAAGAIAAHSVRAGEAVRQEGQHHHGRRGPRASRRRGSSASPRCGSSRATWARTRRLRAWPAAVAGEHVAVERPFTGRSNLYADARRHPRRRRRPPIDRVNAVDEAITVGDAAGLQAGRRRRDDRHREDHSLCGAGGDARPGPAAWRTAPCGWRLTCAGTWAWSRL